ncbi:Hypothetical protein, putative [Bodo saltans]|uniref:EF-hand domain-containing protein n=1 Tax=Bodo saltans TaxID=75058 RepID=A0A0S4JBS7_BODSA|nr:Hypothetical protein, putative [Bodo saltans]|eukprot:CUG87555.1 Hypothetical protein, putative [Bodo saltans]
MGNGAAHHNATVPARMNGAATTTTTSAAARKNSLNALAEAFESTLHTTLRNSFASILDRLGSIEKRVTSVEERIHAHMSSSSHTAAAAASSGAGMTISVRPMSASDTDASALGTPASGPHNTTDVGVGGSGGGATFLPSTPHAPPSASSTFLNHSSAPGSASSHRGGGVAAAANSATSMSITSRPNSGDNNSSYRGATLFPDAAFPEHGNPLFTEQQLEQKFRRYDVDDRGLLTKAQLVHFYRTHNSFSFDETSDDIESELRRFACPRLDDDAVTFNQFCLVALRLAKF